MDRSERTREFFLFTRPAPNGTESHWNRPEMEPYQIGFAPTWVRGKWSRFGRVLGYPRRSDTRLCIYIYYYCAQSNENSRTSPASRISTQKSSYGGGLRRCDACRVWPCVPHYRIKMFSSQVPILTSLSARTLVLLFFLLPACVCLCALRCACTAVLASLRNTPPTPRWICPISP